MWRGQSEGTRVRNSLSHSGAGELRAVRNDSRRLFGVVALFSIFVNLLMLTGPLYMLQVYDRVLGSRSVETLVALSVLMGFLFLIMGALDFARGRVLARIGAAFQARLDRRVFNATLRLDPSGQSVEAQKSALADLESVQKVLSSPVLTALFDLPWTPVFLLGIFLFHPWMGALAVIGGGILILIAVLNQITTRHPLARATVAAQEAGRLADQIRAEGEMVCALGMKGNAFDRWQRIRGQALEAQIAASDRQGSYTSASRTARLFLQSAMLGLGAYLVLQAELTAGAMIASSILLGRALAPVETVVNQWPAVERARGAWGALAQLLGAVSPEAPRTALPRPRARLDVHQLTVIPPGEQQAALRLVSFEIAPGEAVGVIGPSGAGKSTLARAITGVWRPAGGRLRLGGASLDHYPSDVLGRHIGYLPQRVQLFEGTIAENIARLDPEPDAERVVEAAKKAGAHEMILSLPGGYDTRVDAGGGRLSGGQMQRIGLARALYSDPVLLVLDEPNSNLDNTGSEALNETIAAMKSEGKSVLIMAHRPAAIRLCEKLLMLENGARRAFGPSQEVLREVTRNHVRVAREDGQGGVA